MNRAKLFAAVEFAHAAAHNATLAASYDKINPAKAAEYVSHAEASAYAFLEALFEAQLSQAATTNEQKAA